MFRRNWCVLCVVVCLLCLSNAASAQRTTGAISGQVLDQHGAAIVCATVGIVLEERARALGLRSQAVRTARSVFLIWYQANTKSKFSVQVLKPTPVR